MWVSAGRAEKNFGIVDDLKTSKSLFSTPEIKIQLVREVSFLDVLC